MTDTRKVTKERVEELREWVGFFGKLKIQPEYFRLMPDRDRLPELRKVSADLLLILDRYEAALPLIEAAMGITRRDYYLIEGVAQRVEKLVDAALALREKEKP
jgi:hypothetical protein